MRLGHYHCHVRPGPKGTGAEHAQYIERSGRFQAEKYGELGEHERGNLPEWARGSAVRFFAAADEFERANGNSYREFEMSLPIDLSHAERVKLVREFVAEQLGDRFAYTWAIHEPRGHNPHVHIMFSERIQDGTLRGPEQYFKRANTKHPERGGCLKSDWFTGRGGPEAIEALRARWGQVQNLAFERLGLDVRVDHRSLEAQGIEREPGRHRGPAVSGIEARGEVAEVTVRREAERTLRHAARREVVAEIRQVTREEVAAERVAVRERRALAAEVTGEDRDLVLPRVEADRREQLGRAQAAAERRVERRQGLGVGERLVGQARALRERISAQLGRVKEWVRERFPAPFGKIQERTRELFEAVAEKTRGRETQGPRRLTLEEIRARARENWRAYRAEQLAKERGAEPSAKPSQEVQKAPSLSLEERQQQAAERWAESRRQQLLEPGREQKPDQEIEKSREKNLDHGIEDDFGP